MYLGKLVLPEEQQHGHLSRYDGVVEGVLDPGGAVLHMEDVEDEDPADHDLVDQLGQRATAVVVTAAEIGALGEGKEHQSIYKRYAM